MTFFGIRNRGIGETPGTVTVTDVSTEILPANVDRSFATIRNVGRNMVSCACDQTAILDAGLPIDKNGGGLSIDSTNFTTGAINGICAAGEESIVQFQDFSKD